MSAVRNARPRMIHGAGIDTLTEKQFQNYIVEMSQFYGWIRKYHNLYAVGSDPGYPDLTMFHPTLGVCWIEVKGPRGRIGLEQIAWIEDMQRSGQHAYVAFPWHYEHVETMLRGELNRPDLSRHPVAIEIDQAVEYQGVIE